VSPGRINQNVTTRSTVKLPRPWSRMRRFSSVPSLLGK
jgi:hypothetical protein